MNRVNDHCAEVAFVGKAKRMVRRNEEWVTCARLFFTFFPGSYYIHVPKVCEPG